MFSLSSSDLAESKLPQSVLRHPNLVQFLGASLPQPKLNQAPMIIYELMEGNSLEDVFRRKSHKHRFWKPSRSEVPFQILPRLPKTGIGKRSLVPRCPGNHSNVKEFGGGRKRRKKMCPRRAGENVEESVPVLVLILRTCYKTWPITMHVRIPSIHPGSDAGPCRADLDVVDGPFSCTVFLAPI